MIATPWAVREGNRVGGSGEGEAEAEGEPAEAGGGGTTGFCRMEFVREANTCRGALVQRGSGSGGGNGGNGGGGAGLISGTGGTAAVVPEQPLMLHGGHRRRPFVQSRRVSEWSGFVGSHLSHPLPRTTHVKDPHLICHPICRRSCSWIPAADGRMGDH